MGDKLVKIISRSNFIHNNKYDYSLIDEYIGVMNKYPIICPEHGVWEVSFDNHTTKKSGCPKCKGMNLSKDEKIYIANNIHDNKYDYSKLPKTIQTKEKVIIICKRCKNEFCNSWDNHTNKKQGCPKCNPPGRKKVSIDTLKLKINKLNTGYEYDWDSFLGYYNNSFRIKCDKHGWFNQQISNHLFGQRCPNCNISRGEEEIKKFLENNNIIYETQKRFEGCKNKRSLPFDFYIPSKNLCIEYDGELHYQSVKFFGGDKSLQKTKKHDEIKTRFCEMEGISLIRISYMNFKNIEKIIRYEV